MAKQTAGYAIAALRASNEKLQGERDALVKAIRAIYEWYDRDGSVGEADRVFEENRAVIASVVGGSSK